MPIFGDSVFTETIKLKLGNYVVKKKTKQNSETYYV